MQTPDRPRDLQVRQDLNGLRYRVSEWDGALWRWVLCYLALVALPLLGIAALHVLGAASLVASLTDWAAMFVVYLAPLLSGFWVRQQVQADVRIDAKGMTIRRRDGSHHLLWAVCDGVRRKGRRVEACIDGRWLRLPSPNAAVDAMWLEERIASKIAARQDDAQTVPAEVAAALRALRAR